MHKQVTAVSRACYYQIRKIGCIRQFIPKDACITLVNSLVTPRLDYDNALLYGIPKLLTARLQGAQNRGACLVTRTRKREYTTPVLKSLHWLPVVYRPMYKLLLYIWRNLWYPTIQDVHCDRSQVACYVYQRHVRQPMEIAVSASQLPPCGTIYHW